MSGLKCLVSVAVIAACVAAAVYWHAAVQPELMSQQALRQLEIHTDGAGNQAAAQRRTLAWLQSQPIELLLGAAALVLLAVIWRDGKGRPAASISELAPNRKAEQA
jgi:hypothetical protein